MPRTSACTDIAPLACTSRSTTEVGADVVTLERACGMTLKARSRAGASRLESAPAIAFGPRSRVWMTPPGTSRKHGIVCGVLASSRAHGVATLWVVSQALQRGGASPPRLLALVRRGIRLRHYSRRTEEAYVAWIRRFVRFHGMRHPAELAEQDVARCAALRHRRAGRRREDPAAPRLRRGDRRRPGRPAELRRRGFRLQAAAVRLRAIPEEFEPVMVG